MYSVPLAVVADDRRAVVGVAEIQPGRGELLHVEVVRLAAERRARLFAFFGVVLDVLRDRMPALDDPFGVAHRELRDLRGDRPPLGLVGVDHCRSCPAAQDGPEGPGQVEHVGDARVHAVAAVRDPQVRRVAGDEDPPVAEPVGDQATGHPVFLADDLVPEAVVHAEDGADAPVPVR